MNRVCDSPDLDWQEIALRCSERQHRVLRMLVLGYRPGEIATALSVSAGRVTQLKREISEKAAELGYGPA